MANNNSSATDTEESIQFIQRIRRSKAGRILLPAVSAILIVLASYFVGSKLLAGIQQLRQSHIHIKTSPILFSLLITWICVILGGPIWYLVQRGTGSTLRLRTCMSIHLLANLAGYLPGYGWKHLGKAYLTSQNQVSVYVASWAVLIEFICLALTRLAITVTFATPMNLVRIFPQNTKMVTWVLRVVSWALVVIGPLLIKGISKKSPKTVFKSLSNYHHQYIWLSEVVMCFVWIIYGIGYATLVSAIIPVELSQYPVFIFSTTASYLVSLIVFFIPAGIGVREAVLITTMVNVIPDAVSSIGSVLSRGVLIVSELLGVLVGVVIKERSK